MPTAARRSVLPTGAARRARATLTGRFIGTGREDSGGQQRASVRRDAVTIADVATDLDTAPAERERPRASTGRLESRRGACLALAAIVLGGFALYAGTAQLVETPRVFPDEIIYGEAAASLGEGDGLRLRGEPYEYGPLYPAVLAPAFAVFEDRALAYDIVKAINALLFALVAVPVYLLARRLLSRRSSLGVAALALLVPSSMLTSLVMTEALAYLAAAWLLYAIALALERPTVARQFGVLAGTVVAYAARPQLAAIYGTFLAAIPLSWLLLPGGLSRWKLSARELWPTGLSAPRRCRSGRHAARDGIVAARSIRGALAVVRSARRRALVRLPLGRPRAVCRRRPCSWLLRSRWSRSHVAAVPAPPPPPPSPPSS